ncbi:kinesin-like protein KIN-UA [Xenia sp. Carnegie-2017]|uniref:kinesin-like protein KIN-UA n=1 Tax=Xenia sp. Carnegie-2017 TaxID=2897299 RepID=UPI001F040F7B|nr:kinesin-like protein KIN-UA [Xenia sp. Carnegie-2017]
MKRRSLKRPKSGVVKIGRALNRVKCYVRVRPLSSTEVDREDKLAVEVSENGKKITVNDSRIGLDKNYQFDQVFPPTTTNAEISNFICKPLVNAALNGFNGTVMAYGQTGSGKTHTLMSPDGIAATIIEKCFHKMTRNVNFQYKVSMSYLQIYQEKIYDLLNNSTPSKVDLTIREHPQKGIYVENLSEYVVRGPEEVRSLMQLGKKRLVFAETKMNRTSSRSHSVCILSIERSSAHFDKGKPTSSSIMQKKFDEKIHPTQVSEDVHSSKTSQQDEGSSDSENDDDVLSKMMAFNEDVVLKGHLYICDLAGSERIKKTNAEGERLSEAQYINFSLLELGNVIQALAESNETGRTGHIPFRNSTLTRLLQESFGGNCKTSLVVCCSPSEIHAHETKCSLNFGSRAMKIRNTAYVNVEMDYKKLSDDLAKILDARDKEIEQLKVKQKHELDIIKKEATLAAEIKFSDELSEAKRAYASLQHLMDSQANVHAESMLKLQDDLSREKDSRLVLERKLKNERGIVDVTKSRRTKCLLLNEVLSMQLFYALECTALGTSEMKSEASKHLTTSDTAVETQDEILRNIDHHIGVLQTYLHVTERDLSKINGEEVYDEKWKLSFELIEDGKDFQTLVVKIRDRLKMLKDNVDDRILKLLLRFIHSKESSSIEGMSQVYQALEQFLLSTKETSESKFLENPQDIESCLTYVLLDKALLCCLVVLKRNALEKN